MPLVPFTENGYPYTVAEQKIIDYISLNLNSIHLMTIGQLSKNLNMSEATISRFANHAGFQNFKSMKNELMKLTEIETPADKMSATLKENNSSEWMGFLRYQQYCIEKTIENLSDDALTASVDAILSARKVYIHAKGAATSLSRLLEFRLKRFGLEVELLPSAGSELFESLIHIRSEDVIILFGFQKISREAQVLLKQRKDIPYRAILLSSRFYDHEDSRGDYNIYVYRGEPGEYHSLTAPTAVIDAMIIMIAGKLGEKSFQTLQDLHQLKQKYQVDIPR